MQISKVSFMNFQGGKKITPQTIKKTVNPMEEFIKSEKNIHTYYPESISSGSPTTVYPNQYFEQYAENRKVMQNLPKPEKKDIGADYYPPFDITK